MFPSHDRKGEKVKGATKDMKKAAKDMSTKDVKDFARTKHKGLPNRVSEAINVQSIKDEVMGAVRSGNPREMKRVDDTIARRIRDLMDLRGTAGKEVDAEISTALPVLKKAQMYLRDKSKMAEGAKQKGLWHNIHAKRKRGERPAKPGEKGYPIHGIVTGKHLSFLEDRQCC